MEHFPNEDEPRRHGGTEMMTEERTVGPFHVEHFLKWATQTVPRGTFHGEPEQGDGSTWNISPFRREPDGFHVEHFENE